MISADHECIGIFSDVGVRARCYCGKLAKAGIRQPDRSEEKYSEELLETFKLFFRYDPETGKFYHRKGPFKNRVAGTRDFARGVKCRKLYWKLGKGLPRYYVYEHTAAWWYMTGKYPESRVKHLNGNRFDNRWSNLSITDNCGQDNQMELYFQILRQANV